MIVDISDIQKEYAEMMAGLGRVHDGSKHAVNTRKGLVIGYVM